jgi:hypothetical protein
MHKLFLTRVDPGSIHTLHLSDIFHDLSLKPIAEVLGGGWTALKHLSITGYFLRTSLTEFIETLCVSESITQPFQLESLQINSYAGERVLGKLLTSPYCVNSLRRLTLDYGFMQWSDVNQYNQDDEYEQSDPQSCRGALHTLRELEIHSSKVHVDMQMVELRQLSVLCSGVTLRRVECYSVDVNSYVQYLSMFSWFASEERPIISSHWKREIGTCSFPPVEIRPFACLICDASGYGGWTGEHR